MARSKKSYLPQDGFETTCLQVRRAYQSHFGKPIADDVTYSAALQEIVASMGMEKAKEFILGQSNDPSLKEV